MCRHAGATFITDEGLWLVETHRLWLLDPDTWETRRLWAMPDPLKASVGAHDGAGRIAIASFRDFRRGKVWWYDLDTILRPGVSTLTPDNAALIHGAPEQAQGAVWADLGPGPERLWFATSNTRCGNLVGPGKQTRAFIPGAEGMHAGDEIDLWVLSESTARVYAEQGGRPVVPMLARLDVTHLRDWPRADCVP